MKENSREEDITRIKQRIEDVKEYIEYGLPYSEYLDLENSFDNILTDYKRVLKELEEKTTILLAGAEKVKQLEKENEELNLKYHMLYTEKIDKQKAQEVKIKSQVIPIQKVKDKIEKEIKYHEKNILDIENITMLKGKTAKEEAEIEFNKYAIVVLKKMLQELLEGRK